MRLSLKKAARSFYLIRASPGLQSGGAGFQTR